MTVLVVEATMLAAAVAADPWRGPEYGGPPPRRATPPPPLPAAGPPPGPVVELALWSSVEAVADE